MKKIILFSFTIISLTLIGCAKEEAQLDNKEFSVLKANVEATDLTRVGFTKENTKWSFFWHCNDEIWVNKGIMSTKDATGTKAASFTGYSVDTESGYAVYPYAKAENKVSEAGVLTWSFPDTYEYTSIDETFFNTAQEVPMYAVVSNGSASFKHLAAICAFRFNEWSHTGKHRFELHTSKKITGDFNVDLKSKTPTIVTETAGEDCVTVTYDRHENAGEGSIVFYVPVPTGTYNLEIKVYVDDQLKFTKSAENVIVKRADIVSSEFGKNTIIGGDGEIVTTEEELQAALTDEDIKKTIVLGKDITLTEGITINAGKDITLNLNGKTISQEKECTASYQMISNNGKLTITGNGTISFKDTGAGDPNFGWGSYTIRNQGTLVVENGKIEHLGEQNVDGQPVKHMICAIFQYDGSTTINDGTISTPHYRSVRHWSGDMTINGGEYDGQFWVQAVNNTAKLSIKGGEFSPNWNDGSSIFIGNKSDGTIYTVDLAITDGTFTTKVGCNVEEAGVKGKITGGTFTETAKTNTPSYLIGEGYSFTQNNDNTYTLGKSNN